MAFPTFYPVKQSAVEAADGWETSPGAWCQNAGFVSNGPFVCTEWNHDTSMTYEKNPYWYDADSVELEKIEFMLSADDTAIYAAYNAGNVDFIDTPGLVDGNVEYPFDVNRVLLFLADFVDLIFVFLDPHEQALGSRTMEVVKMLNENHYDKICYYLTKIDTLDSISDLMKVSNQTTQNLALRVKNTHGWELPTIYLTHEGESEENEFQHVNMISKPCDKIDLVNVHRHFEQ